MKSLTMKFGDKTIHIDAVDINTSQDTIEGYGVRTQPSKSVLGKFIADNLDQRWRDKQAIIDALMEKPDDIPPHLEEKRAMLMAMAAQGVPLIHAPLDLQDTGLEGDEMNAPLLLEGRDFHRNPTLDRYIPCKVSAADQSSDPKYITFRPTAHAFKFVEPLNVTIVEELSDEQYAKVRQMFEKIGLKGDDEFFYHNAFISTESELYEFILMADDGDEKFPENETYQDLIVRKEKYVSVKFKEVYGIDLATSHIKLVDLIKQI